MTFSKTLEDVVNGARKLEDFTNTIVSSAIEDVLLRVSREYGLDFSKLVADYKDDVLDKHVLLGSGSATCRGITTTKKPCGRKAVCRGYCRGHSSQGATRDTLDKKGVYYSSMTFKKGADDTILNSLKKLGAESIESRMISKCDALTL
jgi:hypothetical protein